MENNEKTILSLREELSSVKGKLNVSRECCANLSLELKTNTTTTKQLGISNGELSQQNARLKKRGRTYMKVEDKLHMIVENIVRWDHDQFYLKISTIQRLFEHSSKPFFEFKRTLKSRGYTVEKAEVEGEDHFKCRHPHFTKVDIETQMRLYKKRRTVDDNLWELWEDDDNDDIAKSTFPAPEFESSDSSNSLLDGLLSGKNRQDSSNSLLMK